MYHELFLHCLGSDVPRSASDNYKLVDVKEASRETTLCLAAAHALVRLDDGPIVGDPMEKTTLDALNWQLSKGMHLSCTPYTLSDIHVPGDVVTSSEASTPHRTTLTIRRRFQFSSALKRMSTICALPNGRLVVAVKGAPETIRGMLTEVPAFYEETYKHYTRRGSRVLALGFREMDSMAGEKLNKLHRDQVETDLTFVGFLVFHCPLKADAVETLKMLADSSHRVSISELSACDQLTE